MISKRHVYTQLRGETPKVGEPSTDWILAFGISILASGTLWTIERVTTFWEFVAITLIAWIALGIVSSIMIKLLIRHTRAYCQAIWLILENPASFPPLPFFSKILFSKEKGVLVWLPQHAHEGGVTKETTVSLQFDHQCLSIPFTMALRIRDDFLPQEVAERASLLGKHAYCIWSDVVSQIRSALDAIPDIREQCSAYVENEITELQLRELIITKIEVPQLPFSNIDELRIECGEPSVRFAKATT